MEIFDKTMKVLERKMDLAFKRHSVLAGNVANYSTPGYKARELDFSGELTRMIGSEKEQIVKTNPTHLSDYGPARSAHIVLDPTGAVGADGNNVDLDTQMGKLSANARSYTGAANLLQMKLRIFRLLSRSGGGV